MPVLALFILLPLVEIALFVTIGAWLGVWTTIMIVLATALLGFSVVRRQGFVTMDQMRDAMQSRRDPGRVLADGGLTLFAGILLILPGFLTDSVGLLLLVPWVRQLVTRFAGSRLRMQGVVMEGSVERPTHRPETEPDTIDGDFFEVDPSKRPTHRPSGWTRH